jgi:hypothetical protein
MTQTKSEKLVPKRIGGVKIPKRMRQGAEAFASLLTTPEARKVAAEILIAVAGVLASGARPGEAIAGSGENAKKGSADAKAAAGSGKAARATGVVVDVVSEAARHILPAARTGEDRDPEAFDTSGDSPKRKKNRERPSSH